MADPWAGITLLLPFYISTPVLSGTSPGYRLFCTRERERERERERGKMREKKEARTNRDSQVFITAVHRGYVHTVNVLLTGSQIVLFMKQLTIAFKYCV